MDWRERTYYWVRLNLSDISRFKTGHDGYGKNYERRVRELKKIPGLRMHPLPSMALAREEREKVPRWAQMLVSCRRAHLSTLMNTFIRFGAESYGYFSWERAVEPKKGEKRKMKAGEKIEAGDLVRVLDGSGIEDYCGGWTPQMDMFVGRILEVNSVVNELGWKGRGVKLEYGGGYTWDTRGLELVTKCKVRPEAETKAGKRVPPDKETVGKAGTKRMNKIIIDGKEYDLSDELAEKIKAEVTEQEIERKMSENPFERTEPRLPYWFIDSNGGVDFDTAAAHSQFTDFRFFVGNYCTDKSLMEQRALHETLNRLLWRYSETHKEPKTSSLLYLLSIRREDGEVSFYSFDDRTAPIDANFFCSRTAAEAAIEEVVKPFMAAHPELEW